MPQKILNVDPGSHNADPTLSSWSQQIVVLNLFHKPIKLLILVTKCMPKDPDLLMFGLEMKKLVKSE